MIMSKRVSKRVSKKHLCGLESCSEVVEDDKPGINATSVNVGTICSAAVLMRLHMIFCLKLTLKYFGNVIAVLILILSK